MLKNYIKIAWRSIWKNKLFSLIKISSLALGLSVSFVIGVMVYYDFTFDTFHSDKDRIYRVTTEFVSADGNFYNPGVAVPLADALKEGIPGIETVAPFFTTYPLHIKNNETDKKFKNPEFVIYADHGFFKTFDYKWLAGSTKNILENPNELVLTETRAKKYFPNKTLDEIIGSSLIYNDTIPMLITGVVAGFEKRTDLVFQEFISLKTANQADMTSAVKNSDWNSTNSASQLFVKSIKNAKTTDIQLALNKISKENKDPDEEAYGNERNFYLQPLTEMHFDENYYTFDFDSGSVGKSVLISLGFVALFLLLLGCINFINLNTAQATQRAKEIGIRKTLGSSKKQLIFQFLGETFLLTVFASIISVVLSFWLIRIFAEFIPKGLSSELFYEPIVLVCILVLLLIVTVLSGFYPALVLSNFKPISVLKNQNLKGNDKIALRKYLTVFQFVIAQVFIIGTLLVGKQINFLMAKDMGFKTEAIANIRTPWNNPSEEKKQQLINNIKSMPEVVSISLAQDPPASFSTSSTDVSYFDEDKEIRTTLQLLYGDKNYLKLYDIEILAGRQQLNDSIREYVINETCMKKLGFQNPHEAIGKMLKLDDMQYPIVGVIKDFNQRSLKSGINPLAFMGTGGTDRSFSVVHFSLHSISKENLPEIIKKVENMWSAIYPDDEIRLNFMDDTIERFYRQERKTATLLNWATGLAILISCLGLLGLVVYSTERRTKEIGIRKVLGASVVQLNVLLSKEFLTLVGIAFAIATPIAWFGLNYWLEGFAYKTEMSWWVFAISGLAMILVALLIMSIKTLSAANSNPVESLRTD